MRGREEEEREKRGSEGEGRGTVEGRGIEYGRKGTVDDDGEKRAEGLEWAKVEVKERR